MYNNEHASSSKTTGTTLLQFVILGLFCIIILRLWYFQIYKGEDYAEKARDNILRKQTIYAPRGLIRDRSGIILAENKPSYALAIIREDCRDIPQALAQVGEWTNTPLPELRERFKRDRTRVEPFKPQQLVSNLDFHTLALVQSHLVDWPGLEILIRPQRHYPQGSAFSHVLGYVAQANERELQEHSMLQLGDHIGKRGIELTMEDRLRGEKGLRQSEVNAQGRELEVQTLRKPEPGQDLSLTIDLELQKFARDQLGNNTGAVVVMQPHTGDLLALASKPGYDNNLFVQGLDRERWKEIVSDPKHPLRNRTHQSTYPPGSVFKLVTAACALHRDTMETEKKIYCPGFYRYGNRVFNCWQERGHGKMNLHDAIKQSCDVYFYKLGEEIGVQALSDFARACGFDKKTGIALPDENSGVIPDKQWKLRHFGSRWQGGETLNMSIGQGFTLVTPLQVARYVSALVNGGRLLRPKLLLSGNTRTLGTLPISDQERAFILDAMVATVDEPHGTAWRLRTRNATVGGKTGTAQVVKLHEEDRDKELEEIPYQYRDHAWMASFVAGGGKSYVIVCMVEHGGHGSSAAGPVVKSVIDYLIQP
jgi:penicillin-binding protein 2